MNNHVIKETQSIKSEIEIFSKKLIFGVSDDIQNGIKRIIKDIYFYKYLANSLEENHFINSIISDYMFLLNSLKDNNYRYVNLNLRSIIEHNLRFFLDKSQKADARTSQLIDKSEEELRGSRFVDFSKVVSTYKSTCNFVHGNSLANMQVVRFYNETMEMHFNERSHRRLINQINNTTLELITMLLEKEYELIDYAFHRRKTILKYLVNEDFVGRLNVLVY